jgi:hypothetical protein
MPFPVPLARKLDGGADNLVIEECTDRTFVVRTDDPFVRQHFADKNLCSLTSPKPHSDHRSPNGMLCVVSAGMPWPSLVSQ